MFSFFDNQKNPFMNMMNTEAQAPNQGMNLPITPFMQQAFMLQMQFMQGMYMMPLYMMQGFMNTLGQFTGSAAPKKPAPGQADGFRLGNMEVPPELLGKLMSMEMSPQNLEKLQKSLDTFFEAMPKAKRTKAD